MGETGQITSVPFAMDVAFAFQSFLTRSLEALLGESIQVRLTRMYVFEDQHGQLLTREGYVIPDVQLIDRASGDIIGLLDAKCESEFPVLPPSDYYQGYVYSDLFSRLRAGRLVPIALCGPSSSTQLLGIRRSAVHLDSRASRPLVATLGVNVRGLLSSDQTVRRTEKLALVDAVRELLSLSCSN
jgi:hypothetical protein